MNKIETSLQLIKLHETASDQVVVIDGGAHHGKFSLAAISFIGHPKIIAFEPYPDSWEIAMKSLSHYKNIEVINAALSEKEGKSEFYSGIYSQTNSLLPRPNNILKPYFPEEATLEGGIFVDVVSIEAECDRREIKYVDILKLDLQGAELAALKGAESLLKAQAIKLILVEVVFIEKYKDQAMFWEVWQYLQRFGYSLYSLEEIKIGLYNECTEFSPRQGQWNQADAIFISKSIRNLLDRKHPSEK